MEILLLSRGQTTTECEPQLKKEVSSVMSQVPTTITWTCVKKEITGYFCLGCKRERLTLCAFITLILQLMEGNL